MKTTNVTEAAVLKTIDQLDARFWPEEWLVALNEAGKAGIVLRRIAELELAGHDTSKMIAALRTGERVA